MSPIEPDQEPERWVVKSNQLVEARYQHSLMTARLIMMAIEDISMYDKQFREVRAYLSDYARLADTSAKNLYELARDLSDEMLGLEIEFPVRDRAGEVTGWERLNVFSKVRYIDGKGYVIVKLNNDLAPYLLQLKAEFTRYKLASVFGVRTPTAVRIYELCKQFQTIGQRTIELDALRRMFMLEDKYPRYRDFRRRVLDHSVDEINRRTDLRVGFDEVRLGRKVHAIRFHIRKAPQRQMPISFPDGGDVQGSPPEASHDDFDYWYDSLPDGERVRLWDETEALALEQGAVRGAGLESRVWLLLRRRWEQDRFGS